MREPATGTLGVSTEKICIVMSYLNPDWARDEEVNVPFRVYVSIPRPGFVPSPRGLSRPVSALKGFPAVQAEAAMAGRERLGKEER